MHHYLLFLFTLFTFSSSSLVKWLPSTSFSLATNFIDGHTPCSKQTVVFPERLISSVELEPGTSVDGFVLPMDGMLILSEGSLYIGEDPNDQNCTNDKNAYYMDKAESSWNQPDVWSSTRFNKATPDAERVPCFNDVVEFPEKGEFSVILPEIIQDVREIKVSGKSVTTLGFIENIHLNEKPSQFFILNSRGETGIEVVDDECHSPGGCPCQRRMLDIDCSVKYCPAPKCAYPIKPIGNCCQICGGVLIFDANNFHLLEFHELVEEVCESYGKNLLDYHVERLPGDKVQLVVVEKGEYLGISAQVVNEISYRMEKKDWGQSMKEAQLSGSPSNKSGLGGVIAFSMFFVVVSVMIAIYAYYYKLPEIRFPLSGQFRSRGMFSRFQRRTDSVVSLTGRDSSAAIGSESGRAFRNPLYDSKRGRVVVTESILEE